jgi:hypothetical protein
MRLIEKRDRVEASEKYILKYATKYNRLEVIKYRNRKNI